MAPTTRPAANDTSVTDPDEEVHTYLFDNINLIADSFDTPSDMCPWLIYGAPSEASFDADIVAPSLSAHSPQVMRTGDFESVVPMKLSHATSPLTPELYYLMVNSFSKISPHHFQYCHSTPEGFRSHYFGSDASIAAVVHQLDTDFDKFMRACLEDPYDWGSALLSKHYVDTTIIPSLAEHASSEPSVVGLRLHELTTQAYDGDVVPLVKFLVGFNSRRSQIISLVLCVTSPRLTVNNHQTYNCAALKLKRATGNIETAVRHFLSTINGGTLVQDKLSDSEASSSKRVFSRSTAESRSGPPNKGFYGKRKGPKNKPYFKNKSGRLAKGHWNSDGQKTSQKASQKPSPHQQLSKRHCSDGSLGNPPPGKRVSSFTEKCILVFITFLPAILGGGAYWVGSLTSN